MWAIYALTEPVTGEVRYIGKTVCLHQRIAGHMRAVGVSRRAQWIRSLKEADQKPGSFVLETGDGDWAAAEIRWIAHYRSAGFNLLNATIGGGVVRKPDLVRKTRRVRPTVVVPLPADASDAAKQLRAAQCAMLEAERSAAWNRDQRDELVRALRRDDPDQWSYSTLAREVECSPELIAVIVKGVPPRGGSGYRRP